MKPYLQGKKTVTQTSLRPAPGMTAVSASLAPRTTEGLNSPAPSHKNHGAGTPTVEAIKEGDKVVRLIVTCSCGEQIEVQCLYPAAK